MGKANNAENALLQMEAGQTLVPLSAMTVVPVPIQADSALILLAVSE